MIDITVVPTDINEIPIWENHPWQFIIPKAVEVRLFRHETGNLLVLAVTIADNHVIHCDSELTDGDLECPDTPRKVLRPMLNNLGSSIFEQEHPGQFLAMIRRQVEFVHSTKSDSEYAPEDLALWRRYKSLVPF